MGDCHFGFDSAVINGAVPAIQAARGRALEDM